MINRRMKSSKRVNRDYTPVLEGKLWDYTKDKLTRGLGGEVKQNLEVVLENTRNALLASTQMQNITYLPKLVLPLTRRLFPQLIANNIISTQPLNGPMGWVRFLDAYITSPDGVEKNIYPWKPGDTTYSSAQEPVDVELAISTDTPTVQGQLEFDHAEGTLYVELGNKNADSDVWTRIAIVDKNGIISTMANSPANVLGAVDPKTRNYVVSFVTVPTDTGGTNALQVRFHYEKDFQKNIPFGDDQTYSTMTYKITSVAVEAKSRKLGATYSFEAAEDWKNEFNENLEDKIVDYMTKSILLEIDGEIITKLRTSATHFAEWSAELPMTWTRGVPAWYETIMPKINKLSNTIQQTTHLDGASFLVCSPVTATVFQGMIQYRGTGTPSDVEMGIGTVSIGTLSNMYKVYVTPLIPDGQILLGFKGDTPDKTGAVYAPYVPVMLQPIPYAEGQPSILARTRYALEVLRPDYYGVLTVTDL